MKELQHLIQDIKSTELKLAKLKEEASNHYSVLHNKSLLTESDEDLFDVNEYKKRLNKSEKLLQEPELFSKPGRWSYFFEGSVMKWSDEVYRMYEFQDSFEGTLVEFFMSCQDAVSASRFNERGEEIRKTKGKMIMNQFVTTPLGNVKYFSFISTPIFDENDEIIGVKGLVKDITDKVSGEKGLDNFFNLSNDLHCIVHKDRYFVKVSPAWTKLLGYSEEELLSNTYLDFIHPDDLERSNLTVDNLDNSGLMTFENCYVKKSGELVYLSWNSRLDEETQLAYCTARDITKSKIAQDLLINDLSEKELLLREIHHRVKNNLQIISSLLSLQAGANSEQSQLTELYENSRNRIKSMAAIHEMFYQSDELDKIEFGKYLNKLIGDLSLSVLSGQKLINFSLDVETVYVNLDTAIPLGLLINEIVTNSIKYGKDENGDVEIFVKLKVLEGNKLELVIGDNGRNSPKNILNQESDSLGVMLISSLVEQINGEIIQLEEFEGTVYQIVFIKQ